MKKSKARKKRQKAAEIEDCPAAKPLSKHAKRRLRRSKYAQMIDAELSQERHFVGRIIDTINRKGIDIGPDGKPIKADWWKYMSSRNTQNRNASLACLYLMNRAITSLRPDSTLTMT